MLKLFRFRLKTAPETFTQQNDVLASNNLFIYFKGDNGLTQPVLIPLNILNENVHEENFELLDVGNLILAHVKLDATNIRWKLSWIEIERNEENQVHAVFKFPINRWLDSNQISKFEVFVNEGPAHLTSIYTIIVCTGTISSCLQARIHLALIGDGASTLPFDLTAKSSLIQCTTKNLFRPGSKDTFCISSFDSSDVGQLFQVHVRCESYDGLAYYCESIQIVNNITDAKYFFLVNQWFGPNLEKSLSIPLINRCQEANVFTIAIKTTDMFKSDEQGTVYIQMEFSNGKIYEKELRSSETHKIPFQKNNIDFFVVVIDNIGHHQITTAEICLVNKSMNETNRIQWDCAWIEIRDIFYEQQYCHTRDEPLSYIPLTPVIDIPCLKKRD